MNNTLKVTTPNDTEIAMTRVFNAPRALVWRAMTEPDLLKRWLLGPPGWRMTQCEDEARVGGSFRCAWAGPNGEEMTMRGTYQEVVPLERLVRTETFDTGCDAQAGEQLATLELSEANGKTTVRLTVRFPSKEARDQAIAHGMEHGVAAGYNRLDEVFQQTATNP